MVSLFCDKECQNVRILINDLSKYLVHKSFVFFSSLRNKPKIKSFCYTRFCCPQHTTLITVESVAETIVRPFCGKLRSFTVLSIPAAPATYFIISFTITFQIIWQKIHNASCKNSNAFKIMEFSLNGTKFQ